MQKLLRTSAVRWAATLAVVLAAGGIAVPGAARAATPANARLKVLEDVKPTPLFPSRLPRKLRGSDAKLERAGSSFQMFWSLGMVRGVPRGYVEFSRGSYGELDQALQVVRSRGDTERPVRIGSRQVLYLCARVCGYVWREDGFTYGVYGEYNYPAPQGAVEADMRTIIRQLRTWGPSADPGMLPAFGGYIAVSTSKSMTASGDMKAGAMPIRFSSDRRTWSEIGRVLGPGAIPGWVDQPTSVALWAPQIYYLPSIQRYVAYYAALNKATGRRCIGRATSSGLYNFVEDPVGPLLCSPPTLIPQEDYGLIDPALFLDPRTRQLFLLYKRERQKKLPRPVPTQIVIRSIAADGRSAIGRPYEILAPSKSWERRTGGIGWPSVEAPTMLYRDGAYYLFYSGNGFSTDKYAVGVARSSSPVGSPPGKDFEKYAGNPILSGERDPNFCGVGHQDVTYTDRDGWLIFYHGYISVNRPKGRGEKCEGQRYLMWDRLSWDRGWPGVRDGTPGG